jgi:hypothetical protein
MESTKNFQENSTAKDNTSHSNAEPVTSEKSITGWKKIKKINLINKLNYTHFNDETILVKLKHNDYGREIFLKVKPQPCLKNTLECRWIPLKGLAQKLKSYTIEHFLLSDGLKFIRVDAKVQKLDDQGIIMELPEFCYELSSRKIRRHECFHINVELIQNGVIFYGQLIDFSSQAFKVEISIKPPQSFQWIQPDSPVCINLKESNMLHFSGEANIIRYTHEQQKRSYVLAPVKNRLTRFSRKEYRSVRYTLNPSPIAFFLHPITKKVMTLPMHDISGSGFSLEENEDDSVLFPGLILPEIKVEITNDCILKCLSQVIHVKKNDSIEHAGIKCGLAILDMNIQDQMKLARILHRSNNNKNYLCNKVNIDSLWKFFFDAGLMYPEKYGELNNYKKRFKAVYEKIYNESIPIARHFIYQDKGTIYEHIAMLRLFTNAWLFHHYASTLGTYNGPSINIINQIAQYVNDYYLQYSSHMSYIMSYYRPDNRFPGSLFDGFARELNNANGCSIYPMTCLYFNKHLKKDFNLPSSIIIEPAKFEDLLELKHRIGREYSGLMFSALDFEQNLFDNDELSSEYENVGFKREKRLFSVKIYGKLKAVFLVLSSEPGINLSGLTNSIHVFIIDDQDFSKRPFYMVLYKLQKYFQDKNIRVLIHPASYALEKGIPHKKTYNLWITSSQYVDNFINFIKNQ